MFNQYVLFALAFLATAFATIQDIRFREVANWLNFSLIAFALAFRAFIAAETHNIHFFLFGLIGFGICFILALLFYYGKAFAGGDAKLLMGFGAILPYSTYLDLAILPLAFIFILFLVGATYSLCVSVFILTKNKKQFQKEWKKTTMSKYALPSLTLALIFFALGFVNSFFFLLAIIALVPFLYLYTKALDNCMVALTTPDKLTEGDWITKDIRINKNVTIKKTVHGLSAKDIALLQRYHKPVLVKSGIPFVPAFLLTLCIFIYIHSNYTNIVSFTLNMLGVW